MLQNQRKKQEQRADEGKIPRPAAGADGGFREGEKGVDHHFDENLAVPGVFAGEVHGEEADDDIDCQRGQGAVDDGGVVEIESENMDRGRIFHACEGASAGGEDGSRQECESPCLFIHANSPQSLRINQAAHRCRR